MTAEAVDEILNFNKDQQEDYYAILGCDESSTVEQIMAEYKVKALLCHPDKNEGDKECQLQFQKLNEAKEVLCDEAQRNCYDKWRNSGISISFQKWKDMKDHVQQSMHWVKMNNKDRMLPDSEENTDDSSQTMLQAPSVSRRASEGGANVYCKPSFKWDRQPANEVISKFRNYEI